MKKRPSTPPSALHRCRYRPGYRLGFGPNASTAVEALECALAPGFAPVATNLETKSVCLSWLVARTEAMGRSIGATAEKAVPSL